jgi:zinc transporter
MTKHSHILFSYSFDSDGKAIELDNQKISQELKNEGLAWVHLDANSKATKTWLEREVGYLDHLIIDALIAEETRPRVIEFDGGLLIILRGINLNKNSEPEDMVSIRMWIDKERIITVQRRDMKAVFDIRDHIAAGKVIKNSGEFLYNLLYQILAVTSPFLYSLGEKVDALEEKIMTTHNVSFREEILQIRKQSTVFKRYLGPQREAIAKLRICDHQWIDDWAKRHFQEHLDHITLMIEDVEETRDRSQILHDELFHGLTEKLNKSMYSLSLVASIFIPLTFFTSIFSVNIGGLPGLDSDNAFFWMMTTMAAIILGQILIFKRKDLF